MNAEIIARLQESHLGGAVSEILARLDSREDELLRGSKRQLDLLWGIIERADSILARVDAALRSGGGESREIEREIAVIRDLIDAIKAHRG